MPEMENAHALVIGIADYQRIAPLPPTHDARHIADLLADPALCGYPPGQVRLLQDTEATQDAIRRELTNLANQSNADSIVLVSFSGHGGRIEDGPHVGQYLLPVDVVYPGDDELAGSAISGDEFTQALQTIPARKVVVVFDCCHAGGIGQPRHVGLEPTRFRNGLSDGYYEKLQAGRGRVILASSRGSEFSYVLNGSEYGLFTRHLLDGLRGGVVSPDGLVRIFDLFEYLQPRVTADQPQQHPVFKGELEENFPIALHRGGEKASAPVVQGGYRYDAYISYVDREPDSAFVWNTLVPKLESAGLRVAVSNDSEDPGVARVVGIERAIRDAKRIVLILSDNYLADHMAEFQNVLGQTLGIDEGTYRLLPVSIGPISRNRLPTRLSMLNTPDLSHPHRADREFNRFVQALQSPLPRR